MARVLRGNIRWADLKVLAIEPRPLDANDGRDVAPLPVRHLAAATIPAELLQQDVLGRVDMQAMPVAEVDLQTASQLPRVQRGTSGHEQIHLWLRGLVDQVRTRARADGPAKRVNIDVELMRQRGRQPIDISRIERNHDVDADGRPRLSGKRTGNRTADGMGNAQSFEVARNQNRGRNRIHGLPVDQSARIGVSQTGEVRAKDEDGNPQELLARRGTGMTLPDARARQFVCRTREARHGGGPVSRGHLPPRVDFISVSAYPLTDGALSPS